MSDSVIFSISVTVLITGTALLYWLSERAKRKRLGRYIRAFDTPDGAAFLLLGCLQKDIDVFSIPKAITGLSSARVEKRLRTHFDDRNYAISIASPKKNGA